MFPPHTDILDVILYLVAPAILALGTLTRVFSGKWIALIGIAIVAFLLCDTAVQLPFPSAFPPTPDGSVTLVPNVIAGLNAVGVLVFLAVVVCPRDASWLLACLLAAPALSILLFNANAVASCGVPIHHDGIAVEALARAGEQVGALGLLAGAVFAAADRPGWPLTLLRVLVCLGFGIASLAWENSTKNLALAVVMALLPLVVLLRPPGGWGPFMALRVGWRNIGIAAVTALVFAQGVGVAAHFFGWWKHAGTGWIKLGPVALLPMVATYFLLPLALASLATVARPQVLPLIPMRLNLVPGWASIGFILCALTMGAVFIQGESGLVVLIAIAALTWWIACSGRLFSTIAVLALLSVPAGFGLIALYSSPEGLALAAHVLTRFSWLVLGPNDGRAEQFTIAWRVFCEAGWFGTGLRDPGGPLNVGAWTNDFEVMTAARFLGICGAAGLVIAAVLPACALVRGAANEAFSTDADQARPAALFTLTWAVLWSGAALWVAAGSMGITALSGTPLGNASPGFNPLFWVLPVVVWGSARATARASAPMVQKRDLSLALHTVSVLLIALAGLVVSRGWQKLSNRDDGYVVPVRMAGTTRVVLDGDEVVVGDEGRRLKIGDQFTEGPAVLQVESESIAVVGLRFTAGDIDRGITFGKAGRHATIQPDELAALAGFNMSPVPERIALRNDVWLEAPDNRWREMTLHRSGSRLYVEAPMDGSAIRVVTQDGGECVATGAGDRCFVVEASRIVVRGTCAFGVHIDGSGVSLDWTDGAPAPKLLPRDRGVMIGDRTVAPLERSDEAVVGEADAEFGLLGQTGGLYVEDHVLRVGPRPVMPANPRGSEALIIPAAQVAWDEWLGGSETGTVHTSSKCRGAASGGATWGDTRDPLDGGPCVDGSYTTQKDVN